MPFDRVPGSSVPTREVMRHRTCRTYALCETNTCTYVPSLLEPVHLQNRSRYSKNVVPSHPLVRSTNGPWEQKNAMKKLSPLLLLSRIESNFFSPNEKWFPLF